jgi:hypothetical protein
LLKQPDNQKIARRSWGLVEFVSGVEDFQIGPFSGMAKFWAKRPEGVL